MTPLFAATQSSFGPGMTQTQGSMSVDGVSSQLRATQNLQYTPTQDQGRSQTIDWLNPSQVCSSVAFHFLILQSRGYFFLIKYPHTLQLCICFLASRKQALPSSLLPLLPSPSPRYCLVRHKENSKERF